TALFAGRSRPIRSKFVMAPFSSAHGYWHSLKDIDLQMSIYGAQTADAPEFDEAARKYDALLVMSFGGPEGMNDVIPFLENVTRGRNIPRARLEEVAHHYERFGGVSPINGQNRELIAVLEAELSAYGIDLPV